MKNRFVLELLNFFGLTYARWTGEKLEFSSIRIIFKLFQVGIMILVAILANPARNNEDGGGLNFDEFSKFYKVLMKVLAFYAGSWIPFIVITQCVRRQENILMINQMLRIKKIILEMYNPAEKFYKDFEQNCTKWFLFILSWHLMNKTFYYTPFNISVESILNLFVNSMIDFFPEVLNFYIFIIIQFIVFSQKGLNTCLISVTEKKI